MIVTGDALTVLRGMPDESVHCVMTSPPYFGLRDYKVPGQIGLEPTPEAYVARLVEIFRDVRRVLRGDGTLWLNLGDSISRHWQKGDNAGWGKHAAIPDLLPGHNRGPCGLPAKNIMGIPWRVAFALQADGWYLRSDIVWQKANPMPESVTDRPTKAHEYLFLLAKSPSYYYDSVAVKEPCAGRTKHDVTGCGYHAPGQTRQNGNRKVPAGWKTGVGRHDGIEGRYRSGNAVRKLADGTAARLNTHLGSSVPSEDADGFRNRRSVWTLSTKPYKGAHFATFPPALVEPCILAGTSEKGCCPKCGAPWKRNVAKRFRPQSDVCVEKGVRGASDQKPMDSSNTWQGFPRGTTSASTTGWSPSCNCGMDPVPATVLDPFCGVATVGLVCAQHGRDFIGIELNPEYVRLAEERLTRAAESRPGTLPFSETAPR